MTPEEAVARALCRYTWELHFKGRDLEAYVDIHWRDHASAAHVTIKAMDQWRFKAAGITGDVSTQPERDNG